MIKAVVFDYGGVMSSGGRGVEISARIAQNLHISEDEAVRLLDLGWDEYASGRMSEEELWAKIEAAFGAPISSEKRDIWNSWDVMQPIPKMVKLVGNLKSRGLIVGMLSNVIPYTMNQIREHGVYDMFDFTVLSAEVGCAKPETKIYEVMLRKIPDISPHEVVFVDDQKRFLEPAEQLGLQIVLADSPAQIEADLEVLLRAKS